MVKFSQESEDIDSKKKISDIRAQELIKIEFFFLSQLKDSSNSIKEFKGFIYSLKRETISILLPYFKPIFS